MMPTGKASGNAVLAKARADNLDREAGKAWVGGRVDAQRPAREAQP